MFLSREEEKCLIVKDPLRFSSDELCDKNAIGGRSWDVATQEWKVCNMEIEIVTLIVKGSVKLTVSTDFQEQIQVEAEFKCCSPSCL